MAATIPVIDEKTWARIVARAYVNPPPNPPYGPPPNPPFHDFRDKLQKDPKAAVDEARGASDLPGIIIPNPVRLMDLYYSYSTPANPDPIADLLTAIFQGSPTADVLSEIFTKGTLFGQRVELPCGEWIHPKGTRTLFEHATDALSLADWMKIYAYIWHQIRFMHNTTIQEAFEEDPALTLKNNIVPNLTLSKAYDYQKTALFTLGDNSPPYASPETLTDIRNDPGARNYRHRIRMSC
jgi:hypothetical protein